MVGPWRNRAVAESFRWLAGMVGTGSCGVRVQEKTEIVEWMEDSGDI